MGVLREILDTIRDLSTMQKGSMEDVFKKKKYSSISKRSQEGTLQFPVIVSKSLDIDTIQMMTKALERQYASFVQVTLTMNPVLNLSEDVNAAGYLRKFHQNSGTKAGFHDIGNMVKDVLNENYVGFADDVEQKFLFAAVYEGSTSKIIASNKEQLQSILEGVKEDILNNKFVPKDPIYRFKNDNLNYHHNRIVTEAKGRASGSGTSIKYDGDNRSQSYQGDDKRQYDNRTSYLAGSTHDQRTEYLAGSTHDSRREYKTEYQNGSNHDQREHYDSSGGTQKINNSKNTITKAGNDVNQTFTGEIRNLTLSGGGGMKLPEKSKHELPNNILKDNDAKKANELVPTVMHVRTILVDKEGVNQGSMDFLIGIKATMHPVASEEMVSNVLNSVKSKSRFFNTIRWTSGEISFFKDFLFNVKEIKNDVAERSAGSSAWWMALKRRRALSKMKSAMMLPNQILPNASIVMSMEEVEYIKSEYGYDLMNPLFTGKIMNTFFLLGFAVVDNSTQVAHFLFDGQIDFQSVSFTGLERDNKSGGGSDIKDVLKLVQRV